MMFILVATLLCFSGQLSQGRVLSMMDIQSIVDEFGDEILTHQNLNSASPSSAAFGSTNQDLDHIENDFDKDEVPHPVGVHNWGSSLDLGQVSGVTISPDDEPVIFHRGCHKWGPKTFDSNFQLIDRTPIPNNTILTLDPDTATIKTSWGSGMFHVPHGITMDSNGNVYVTDSGLHQVMRFPAGSSKPDLVLGEAFVPGSDEQHFCQPTSISVSEATGIFFVADGYCNSRILKFDKNGKLLKVIDGDWQVVHSLALFEEDDVLCLSDREGHKIDCLRAGLVLGKRADQDETGIKVVSYKGVGRSYGIAAKGTTLLSVSGAPHIRGITIDTAADTPKILDQWGLDEGMVAPHALAISQTGDAVYVADITEGQQKIKKFEVVRSGDFI